MKAPKKIPDGQCNFEKIRTENYAYVDKTRFIEMLEKEPNDYCFLTRPRKFGKSLFISILEHYYDIRFKSQFQELFGDLYVGKNPTGLQNTMFVLFFDFSGIDTSDVESFKISFSAAIRDSVRNFLTEHSGVIKNYEYLKEKLETRNNVRAYTEFAFDIIRSFKKKAYVIIDEYDHFANDLIALGSNLGNEEYKELIWANSIVRDFYEALKIASRTVINKIFITGITPMMLDDVTSGFNIANNLSNDIRYNEILGFTEDEVEFLIDECGIDREKISAIDRKFLYNGYMFHENAEKKLYNSAMILYILYKTNVTEGKIKELINDNLKTDYGRIKNLLNKADNIEKLENIIEYGKIPAEVKSRFSIDKIHDSENFLSLLYYMGILTIDKEVETNDALLSIPNYSIKTMYWEYIREILKSINPQLSHNEIKLRESLRSLVFQEKPEEFIKFIQQFYVSRFSNRDYQRFDEKYIKSIILTLVFQGNYHLPISEYETSGGYVDIYLQHRNLNPLIKLD
jgi:hypothetical protein